MNRTAPVLAKNSTRLVFTIWIPALPMIRNNNTVSGATSVGEPRPFGRTKRSRVRMRGKTLEVYLYLLKRKESSGISEVQNALSFSSPSVASHHLEKLVKLGVVSKDELGRFNLEKKVDISILRGFSNVGSVMIPRFAFYLGFFLIIAIAYVVLNLTNLNFLALVGSVGAAAIFAYESWRVWRRRPSF